MDREAIKKIYKTQCDLISLKADLRDLIEFNKEAESIQSIEITPYFSRPLLIFAPDKIASRVMLNEYIKALKSRMEELQNELDAI
jgi:hypothetical protein